MSIYFKVVLLLCLVHVSTSFVSLQTLDIFNISRYLRILRNLALGDPRYSRVLPMPFDPYQSDHLKGHFQARYGFRGERLVRDIGAGYSLAELKRRGVV